VVCLELVEGFFDGLRPRLPLRSGADGFGDAFLIANSP
jgi:hypothetical protein